MKPFRFDKTIIDGRHALGSTVVMPAAAAPARAPAPAAPAAPTAPPLPPTAAPAPAVPALRSCSPKDDPRLIMLAEPDSERAAALRRLRDNLATKGMPRVLAVSSARAKDGATTCALNLAIAIAEHASYKVLLIDANFAAPALGELLGIDQSTPPYSAWSAPFALSALTRSLHVATVAPLPDGSAPLVDFPTFARVIDCFQRAGYQQIILDVPPLNGAPDAPLLVQLAGGVLLAVRAGVTTKRWLRSAVEQIDKRRALGIALMDAPE